MKTKVDWLTFSLDDDIGKLWMDDIVQAFGHTGELVYTPGKAKLGYEHGACYKLNGATFVQMFWGGASQRNKVTIVLDGSGCNLVRDWSPVVAHLATLKHKKITRLDVALDICDGSVTVPGIYALRHDRDLWTNTKGGRPPSHLPHGDMLETVDFVGRTDDIGSRKGSNTFLRAYEKGVKEFKTLRRADLMTLPIGEDRADVQFKIGDWVRIEVEFKAKSTIIPFTALVDPDSLFVSAYPYLRQLLADVTPMPRVRVENKAITDLDAALKYIFKQHGLTLNSGLAMYGPDMLLTMICASRPNSKLIDRGLNHATALDGGEVVIDSTGEVTMYNGSPVAFKAADSEENTFTVIDGAYHD